MGTARELRPGAGRPPARRADPLPAGRLDHRRPLRQRYLRPPPDRAPRQPRPGRAYAAALRLSAGGGETGAAGESLNSRQARQEQKLRSATESTENTEKYPRRYFSVSSVLSVLS